MINKKILTSFNIGFIRVLMAIVLVLFIFACNKTYVGPDGKILPPMLGDATKVIEVSKTLYTTTLTAAGQLKCDKKIDKETAMKIVDAADIYYISHQAAARALSVWYDSYYTEGATPEEAKLNAKVFFLSLGDQVIILADEYEGLTGEKLPIPVDLTVNTIKAIFGG